MANRKINDEKIKELIERDKAKPLVKSKVLIREDGKPHGKCPICDYPILFTTFAFCPMCGQRLDKENWAFD